MPNVASESTILLEQGMDMLIYGMGTVYVFLFALVMSMVLLSWFIEKFFPEPVINVGQRASVTAPVDPLTTKIIQAAIDQHRAR